MRRMLIVAVTALAIVAAVAGEATAQLCYNC